MRRSWLGFKPAVLPITSLIVHPSVRTIWAKCRRNRETPGASGDYETFRAEITGGVLRAVGVRRLLLTFDVALRYRFA
jgi:hypothetical protein